VTIVDDEDESGPEPTGIICRVWPTGCAHPHLCQDACFDDDLVREREYREESDGETSVAVDDPVALTVAAVLGLLVVYCLAVKKILNK
jgi:hypothetical protein